MLKSLFYKRFNLRIGIFDSGLGGLTVVKEIANRFKNVEINYIADTKNAPYGEKTEEEILKFSKDITKYLIKNHKIDALVVACNTATSAAISYLREEFKNLIIIGIEPGVKPALSLTKTGNIGVLATNATIKGQKYKNLLNSLCINSCSNIYSQSCPGLVEQIELGLIDDVQTIKMLEGWLLPMKDKRVDTIVLGCTHYPIIEHNIRKILDKVNIIHTGEAIAKRLEELSRKLDLIRSTDFKVNIYYTGKLNTSMVNIVLGPKVKCEKIEIKEDNE